MKKKKPEFKRHPKLKRLGDKWRRPRGRHNKLRRRFKGKGAVPNPGYGSPTKGMHPCGLYEVLVENVKDLEKINPEKECARISGKVGKRKRLEILKRAEELKIKVLNPCVGDKK